LKPDLKLSANHTAVGDLAQKNAAEKIQPQVFFRPEERNP
jgi:hypothetical protein